LLFILFKDAVYNDVALCKPMSGEPEATLGLHVSASL